MPILLHNRRCSELFELPNIEQLGTQSTLSLEVLPQLLCDCLLEKFSDSISHADWLKRGWVSDWSAGFCGNTSRAIFHRVGNTPPFKVELKTTSSIPGLVRCTIWSCRLSSLGTKVHTCHPSKVKKSSKAGSGLDFKTIPLVFTIKFVNGGGKCHSRLGRLQPL